MNFDVLKILPFCKSVTKFTVNHFQCFVKNHHDLNNQISQFFCLSNEEFVLSDSLRSDWSPITAVRANVSFLIGMTLNFSCVSSKQICPCWTVSVWVRGTWTSPKYRYWGSGMFSDSFTLYMISSPWSHFSSLKIEPRVWNTWSDDFQEESPNFYRRKKNHKM